MTRLRPRLVLIGVAAAGWLAGPWLAVAVAQAPSQGPVGPRFPPEVVRLPPVPPVPPPPHGAAAPRTVQPVPDERVFAVPDVEQVLAREPPPAKPKESVKPKKIWSGSFELGLDGTEGNSETFSFRTGFDAKRKTDRNILAVDLDYIQKTNRGEETANRSYLDWKYERLFQSSPWTAVAHGTVDHDEFQSFDVRSTVDLALGYRFVETDETTLSARAGVGTAYESGGPDEGWVPEAVYGAEYEHKLSDRYRFTAKTEYTPDMTGWDDFRVKTQASIEALIDAEMNLNLKLSVRNRYDSTPNGAKANDLDYSVVLLWGF